MHPANTLPRQRQPTNETAAGADVAVLFVRWQEHRDQRAREELVQRFLPLARKLARRYSGAREPFDDLLQVASLGLVKAIDRFDTQRGTAFSSFAVPTILGELKRYFRDLGWAVHVPRGAQEQALKVEEAQQQLTAKTGRPPSVYDLAEYLEFSIEEVLEALETSGAHHCVSLDTPRDDVDGESGTLADAFGETDARFEFVEASVSITSAAQQLSGRERRVLELALRARSHPDSDRRRHRRFADAGVSHSPAGAGAAARADRRRRGFLEPPLGAIPRD